MPEGGMRPLWKGGSAKLRQVAAGSGEQSLSLRSRKARPQVIVKNGY